MDDPKKTAEPVDEEQATATIDLNQLLGGDLARMKAEYLARLKGEQTVPAPDVARSRHPSSATLIIPLPSVEPDILGGDETLVAPPRSSELPDDRAVVPAPPAPPLPTPPILHAAVAQAAPPPPGSTTLPVQPAIAAAAPVSAKRSGVALLLVFAGIAIAAVAAVAGWFLLRGRRGDDRPAPVAESVARKETVTSTLATDTIQLPAAPTPAPTPERASASEPTPAVPLATSRSRAAAPVRERKPATSPAVAQAPPLPEPLQETAAPEPVVPPPPAEGELVSSSDAGVTLPRALREEIPKYPAAARMWRKEGTVTISLLVDHHGTVAEVKVAKSSGDPQLDASALQAAKTSVYIPAMKDGVRVRVWITKTYRFAGSS